MGGKYYIAPLRKLKSFLKIPGLGEKLEDLIKKADKTPSNTTPLEEKFRKKKPPRRRKI
jgi:hypothetical protein